MRVIDMECSVPKLATGDDDTPAASATSPGASAAQRPAGYGMANYEGIFRSRRDGGDTRPDTKLSAWVDLLERAGIVRALPFGASNDQVAIDFPELTIIGGLGGWPWVNEMVALVRRHPRLYLDTSAHRAKYLGQRGSGWEMLMQFGNTLIQDKVLVGLSAGLVGQPHETLIEEYLALPLKDSV